MQLEIQLRIYHQKLLKVLIKRGIGKLVLIWLIRLTWLKTVPALVLKVIFKVTSLDEFSGIKFRFSEKATKFEKISHLFWHLQVTSKQVGDFFQILQPSQNILTVMPKLFLFYFCELAFPFPFSNLFVKPELTF